MKQAVILFEYFQKKEVEKYKMNAYLNYISIASGMGSKEAFKLLSNFLDVKEDREKLEEITEEDI